MGVYLNIPATTKAYLTQLVKDERDMMKKLCRLVFTPTLEPCDCAADPIGSMPGNYWTTGNAFQTLQNCPACGGSGHRAVEVTKEIYLTIEWSPAKWTKTPAEMRLPYGMISAKGDLADLPDLVRANKIIIQLPMEPHITYEYRVAGEPIDENSFFQGNFFVVDLERI